MSEPIFTEIDGRKIKLTNLEKLIFPEAGYIKAEIIQYYQQVAPIMLKYIGNRPLTLIRFPDGIEGKKFYSKDKPDWAPKWIQDIKLEEDDNQYVVAHRIADLVWLGNLAALEIHPMQIRGPEYEFPDHFIFDLDPSPSFSFVDLKSIALKLKIFLESNGYQVFIKTSGSKGLHLYVPIKPLYEHGLFYESIKTLAQKFVSENPKTCTLKMSKEKRLGKVLLDIYRNHRSNSCVAPYSLRAKPNAPISMPFEWSLLDEIKDSQHFKLKDLNINHDAWEGFHEQAVELSDQRNTTVATTTTLSSYEKKRDFVKTDEPLPEVIYGRNDQFVLQLHDASNLHYDLRLEYDGVLWSWAIPKALPVTKLETRMAIRTEDHPIKYLDFEGKIPKNEYGGGEMWIMDRGKYSIIELEEKKIQIKLEGQFFKGEYKLINTGAQQWLVKLLSESLAIPDYKPMLASAALSMDGFGEEYQYEVKWDGIRALIFVDEGQVKIISRSGSNLTSKFPEIVDSLEIDAQSGVLDGEIVILNEKGVSDFPSVISRLHSSVPGNQDAVFYAFDLIYLDGKRLESEPLSKRKDWLEVILKKNEVCRISGFFEDGKALFAAGKDLGIEGVLAKDINGLYHSGDRNSVWQKVKYRSEIVAYIIGYTEGSGDRNPYFGALHLASQEDGEFTYIGKVGSGFNQDSLKEIYSLLEKLPETKQFIEAEISEPSKTKWVEPIIKCEVNFASLTKSGTLREPVFIKIINDKL
ncbi:non-homologous end-joining DNA ligase [Portibacter lacus]|uniref:DNA ligase (ATP) n=1 Tax=Portibacter lacus TaxID=1099794 RepID=A0AA37SNY8_9BACT|nr:non-homologous end-joining DNA ligase [Portibacter lacus]GLR16083.1 multifunctional non-homologous end joining protein LigD [Portibacter lacus]